MDLNKGIKILSDAAGTSPSAVFSYLYQVIYLTAVWLRSVIIFSGIWIYTNSSSIKKNQNRACRFYSVEGRAGFFQKTNTFSQSLNFALYILCPRGQCHLIHLSWPSLAYMCTNLA